MPLATTEDGQIFIQYTGSAYPMLSKILGNRSRIVHKLSLHIAQNGRARAPEFMRQLVAGRGAIVEVTGPGELPPVSRGAEAVLLWPDANGLGWRPIERALMRSGARLSVVNGRRRAFELTPQRWRSIQIRRVLEKYLVGEALFTTVFVLATPVLVLWDFLRGRR